MSTTQRALSQANKKQQHKTENRKRPWLETGKSKLEGRDKE